MIEAFSFGDVSLSVLQPLGQAAGGTPGSSLTLGPLPTHQYPRRKPRKGSVLRMTALAVG